MISTQLGNKLNRIINLGTKGESLSCQRIIRLLNSVSLMLLLLLFCGQFLIYLIIDVSFVSVIFVGFSILCLGAVLWLNKAGKYKVSRILLIVYSNLTVLGGQYAFSNNIGVFAMFFLIFAFYVALLDNWKVILSLSTFTLTIMVLGVYFDDAFEHALVFEKAEVVQLKMVFIIVSTLLILFVTYFLKTNFQFQQNKLELSLEEKNIMLREVHHRVKNNLQVISSLLNIQKRRLSSDQKESIEIIESGQNRMQSMVLIHQEMYNRGGAGNINLQDYVKKLVVNIHVLFKKKGQSIDLIFDLDEIVMDLEKTMSIGLMLNEILTNAFKHAFIDRAFGQIDVRLKSEGKFCILDIQDNGVGFDVNDKDLGRGMGTQLIGNICNQLQGKYNLVQVEGTKHVITFPK